MFNSKKMLQIIVHLLLLNNSRMDKLKLMKELYLIDRESIAERNISVSGDIFFSLPHGPVLSQTLNMIDDIPNGNPWEEYLTVDKRDKYCDVVVKKTFDEGMLSKKEKEYIERISYKYADFQPWDLRNFTHTLPEWSDPKGSNRKITFRSIMKALGKSDEEIECAKQEYDSIVEIYRLLGVQ